MLNTNTIYGTQLPRPLLKFDYSMSTAIHTSPFGGLSNFGPYDKNLWSKSSVQFAIIYLKNHESAIDKFISGFKSGLESFPGFERWFRLSIDKFDKFPITDTTVDAYEKEVNVITRGNYDLIFVVIPGQPRNDILYSQIKLDFLRKGIPTQFLDSERLYSGKSLQWIFQSLGFCLCQDRWNTVGSSST